MKTHSRRLDLNIYPHTLHIAPRFSDLDPQWHLNNVRIGEFYQEGRVSFHGALVREFQLERERGHRTLVAHQSMDYLAEVQYPETVTLGIGVVRIGKTSYSLGLGMFQKGRCVGIANTVLVHATKEGPAALPDRWREVLARKLLPEDARIH